MGLHREPEGGVSGEIQRMLYLDSIQAARIPMPLSAWVMAVLTFALTSVAMRPGRLTQRLGHLATKGCLKTAFSSRASSMDMLWRPPPYDGPTPRNMQNMAPYDPIPFSRDPRQMIAPAFGSQPYNRPMQRRQPSMLGSAKWWIALGRAISAVVTLVAIVIEVLFVLRRVFERHFIVCTS